MKIQDQEVKQKLIHRLRRIAGQLRGVETMVAEERDCQEIMQQLISMNSAMQAASRLFMQQYATTCLLETQELSNAEMRLKHEKLIAEMLALFGKTP